MIISNTGTKPNRVDVDKDKYGSKGELYHLDYAKFCVDSGNSPSINEWRARTRENKLFYKNKQWEKREDIDGFLKDSSGLVRNRIKIVHNIIRPMVEQYRGNASILKINATAKSISKMSVNRREMRLSEKILKTKLAQEFPGLLNIIQENDASVGQNEKETNQTFENLYVDLYVSQLNSLLKYVANENEFQEMQMPISLNLSLSGLVATEAFEHSGELKFRIIESEDMIYDTDARRSDLSDSSFLGYMSPMDVSLILEKYQPDSTKAKIMENYVSHQTSVSNYSNNLQSDRRFSSTRLPVYKIFWKDIDLQEWGYVKDEDGYDFLTRINYIPEGEEVSKYTDKDLIDPPKTSKNKKRFKNGKKAKLYFDVIRYCVFIPGDVLTDSNNGKMGDMKSFDVVLDYGLDPYQETESMSLSNVKYPIKCQTWGFIDGEIFSPVDDAINPQRFLNRILSVTEQLINNSGGSGPIIDEDAIDASDPNQLAIDMKEGRPITVRTKGKGVPNTVGSYDNTPKQGVYNMFNIIPLIKQMTQDTTGVNDALRGESTGSDQLVGVTQLLIQRGSLMQEPFYAAIRNLFIQMYQYIANPGKRMYIENERELSIIVGDDGLEILTLSKDMKHEDFRVFISQENDDAILKANANNMLDIFLERQLIDGKSYSRLYNRSTPEEVTMALRSQAGLRAESERIQAQEQEKALIEAQSEQEFLQERDRSDKLGAQNQQERIVDKTNQAKFDQVIAKEASKAFEV